MRRYRAKYPLKAWLVNFKRAVLRKITDYLTISYWQCNECGCKEDVEQEVACWKCSRGEMLFQIDYRF